MNDFQRARMSRHGDCDADQLDYDRIFKMDEWNPEWAYSTQLLALGRKSVAMQYMLKKMSIFVCLHILDDDHDDDDDDVMMSISWYLLLSVSL